MDFSNANGTGSGDPVFNGGCEVATGRTGADILNPPNSTFLPALASPPRRYDSVKRALDFFAALALFAALLPLIGAAWSLVRATSRGAGIYSQIRVGLGGRPFRIYKLRSMAHNCEATTGGAKWSTAGDARVTPIGRIFRKLHIDELPQLVNVLRGDMSLIGPRPERPEFVKPLTALFPEYKLRLAVRPGVTGLAQIQLPPDTDLDSVRRKIVLDRAYIDDRSVWLDLRLLVGTVIYLAGVPYGVVRNILALPNPLIAEQSCTPSVESTPSLDFSPASFVGRTLGKGRVR